MTKRTRSLAFLLRYIQICEYSTGEENGKKSKSVEIELPPEPTTCCMSGCQNCVWIQYASEITKLLNDGGEQSREIVLSKITDPSLKMFLRMELQQVDFSNKKNE